MNFCYCKNFNIFTRNNFHSIPLLPWTQFSLVWSLLGARSQSASVLSSLQELKDVRDELNNKESQLQDSERQLSGLKGTADKYVDGRFHLIQQERKRGEHLFRGQRVCLSSWVNLSKGTVYVPDVCMVSPSRYRQLKQQFELKVEEEQILQAKLQQSSFHQQQEELERLRKTIGQKEETHTHKIIFMLTGWP